MENLDKAIVQGAINALDIVAQIKRFSTVRGETLIQFHQDIAHPLLNDLLILHPHYVELIEKIGTLQLDVALKYFLVIRTDFDSVRVSAKKTGKYLTKTPIHPIAKLYFECALDCVPIGEVPKNSFKHLTLYSLQGTRLRYRRSVKNTLKAIDYWGTGKRSVKWQKKLSSTDVDDIKYISKLIIEHRSTALCRLCEVYETSRRISYRKDHQGTS